MRLAILSLAATLALVPSVQAAQLKVCTVDWPPYTTVDAKAGTIAGTHTDLVQELFKRMGDEVKIEAPAWERCLNDVKSGTYDGAYSASHKTDRAEYALYPKQALQTVSYVAVVLKGAGGAWDGKDVATLPQPIGAPRGFSITADLKKAGAQVDEGALADEQNLQKLLTGRIKTMVTEARTGASLIAKLKVGEKVEVLTKPVSAGKDYFIIVSKKHGGGEAAAQALADKIDATLATLKADGTVDKLTNK
jgi:polar amino acid transport system substrate-binding protein